MTFRIAIIDSGINPWHSHVNGIAGGLGFSPDEEGRILRTNDFSDQLGHGTALAGIIRLRAPDAALYAAKVFHESLGCPMAALLDAIAWALDENMKLIHLSLGTEREEYRSVLETLSQAAVEKGLIMVAAARGPDDTLLPAVLDGVIGVYWNRECPWGNLVHHPGDAVEFGAHGRPREIPGRPRNANFCGNSFAAAHVTAMAAGLLDGNPSGDIHWVRRALSKTTKRGT